MDNKQLGQIGENIAAEYLKKKGYKILDRNYIKEWDDKTKGEIDIVAKKGGVICFVEVKTSAAAPGGGALAPEDRVNCRKQRQLAKIAQTWLVKNRVPLDSAWQIDVIGIVFDGQGQKISHFENIAEEFA
jgi:putative endonuclease